MIDHQRDAEPVEAIKNSDAAEQSVIVLLFKLKLWSCFCKTHDEKPQCVVQEYKNNSKSGLKASDLDLNVGLDENGESATTLLERKLEGSPGWSLLGIKEMKIDPYQQVSCNEEDCDEESIDEE